MRVSDPQSRCDKASLRSSFPVFPSSGKSDSDVHHVREEECVDIDMGLMSTTGRNLD